MNVIPTTRKIQIMQGLVEGNSIRSLERMTGTHRDTICRLLRYAGERCEALLQEKIRDVRAQEVQVDEIWTYVAKKDKRLTPEDGPQVGSQYVFVGMESHSKLVISHMVGKRDSETAHQFMQDLASRLRNKVQLTTDGFRAYEDAVEAAFGLNVHYAMLDKIYHSNGGPKREGYIPSEIVDLRPISLIGDPDPTRISTSYIERQNLTMRMQMRRLTRLTNAFSKKLENLKAALALHFAWYNFGRIHRTLRVTPAMEAGLTDHVWGMEELARSEN